MTHLYCYWGEAKFGRSAVEPKYLRNCGFALRAVPNGTVPSNPNKYVTMLQNSQKGNGKRVFGNKTATPSATLRSHSATLRSGRNTLGKRNPKFAYRRTSHTRRTICEIRIFSCYGVIRNSCFIYPHYREHEYN